ncbi:hypothetical protein GDO81_008818 [Engystomops pustulosus]|uniref:Uncharacterized protein n=1 Tax=Engystomops pustulosus TaxID=76066 RepID=A0AAV7CH86_ENGPU|nr:hypothetical protein GDO81_008818 [Engystomops pustulosus]
MDAPFPPSPLPLITFRSVAPDRSVPACADRLRYPPAPDRSRCLPLARTVVPAYCAGPLRFRPADLSVPAAAPDPLLPALRRTAPFPPCAGPLRSRPAPDRSVPALRRPSVPPLRRTAPPALRGPLLPCPTSFPPCADLSFLPSPGPPSRPAPTSASARAGPLRSRPAPTLRSRLRVLSFPPCAGPSFPPCAGPSVPPRRPSRSRPAPARSVPACAGPSVTRPAPSPLRSRPAGPLVPPCAGPLRSPCADRSVPALRDRPSPLRGPLLSTPASYPGPPPVLHILNHGTPIKHDCADYIAKQAIN